MKINLTNRNAVGSVVLGTGTPIAGASGPQGAQGVQGAPGPAGGPQGDQGYQGYQGIQGAQGYQGVQGAAGEQGSQGFQGIQGSEGSQGFQGVQGAQGTPGEFAGIGAQGVQGAIGAQGVQGATGSGAQGVQGATGAQGIQGAAGIDGAQGSAGSKGDKGDIGAQGVAGIDGVQGAQGIQGPQGVQGAAGTNGTQGDVGAQGLKGDKGDTGAQGTAGIDGAQGATGSKGDKGDDVNSIAAFNQANAAYDQANSAYLQANTANDNANTRVLKAGDTMTGNLNVAATLFVQNIIPTAFQTYDLGSAEFPFRDLYLSGETLRLGNTSISVVGGGEVSITNLRSGAINANTILVQGYNVYSSLLSAYEAANLKIETIEGELLSVTTSNTGNVVVANVSIREANTTQTGVVQLSDDVNNTSVSLAGTANTVNTAYTQAKLARSEIFGLTSLFTDLNSYVLSALTPFAFAAANTVRISANGGSTLSQQQLNFTNTADVIVSVGAGAGAASGNANIGFTLGSTGVAAGTYGDSTNVATITVDSKGRITNVSNVNIAASQASVNAAYEQANAAYEAANTKLPIAGGTITGDLVISGNLAVLGDSTALNVETLLVEDNEIVLNSNVTGAPSLDAFLTVNRGANSNVSIRWNENDVAWEWTDDGINYIPFASIPTDAYNQANGAYVAANTALTNADLAHDDANLAYSRASSAYDQANAAYDAANTANTTPIEVDDVSIGARRTIDFVSANSSNITISGTDDPSNNKIILTFDNPKLGGSGSGVYANTELYVSDTPPGSANSNVALWWRANTGRFYIYYDDGSSAQWVSLTPSPIVNTSSDLLFSDANTAASIAAANTLNQQKANRTGDTFTGNVSVLQNGTQLNVTSTSIQSNGTLSLVATEYKVNNITISANTGSTSAVAQTVVDILPISEYRTVKYLIQIKSGSSYQATEILLLHDGTTTYMTEYATISTGSYLGSFGSDINSGQMRLLFDPVFAVNTLNISRISAPV